MQLDAWDGSSGINIMTIKNTGNIGIGTQNPLDKLSVSGGYVGISRSAGDTAGVSLYTGNSQRWNWIVNSTAEGGSNSGSNFQIERYDDSGSWLGTPFFIKRSSGYIGIGTTSPAAPLHVASSDTGIQQRYERLGTSAGIADTGTMGDGDFRIYPGGYSNNQPTTFLANGNVGIGINTPSYKLDVAGDINSSTSLYINGVQVCTSSGCTSSSDRRLKKNIAPLKDSLNEILKLQGVSYNWKDPEKFGEGQYIGFIAQDLEKVYPQVVRTDKKTGLKSVAYDHLIAPVIEAIKTMAGKIADFSHRMDVVIKTQNQQERELASLKEAGVAKDAKIRKLESENALIKSYLCAKESSAPFCH